MNNRNNHHAATAAAPAVKAVYLSIASIIAKLSTQGISKDNRNQQQGYSFRGIDDIYNALSKLLAEEGLVIMPRILSRSLKEVQTAKGGMLFYVVLEAEYDFISTKDGSVHTARVYGEAMDSADKATNKAMSAAYKYLCLQTFCIPTSGESPDADAQTHQVTSIQTIQTKPEETTPFTRQYGSAGEINNVLSLAQNLNNLADLYYANRRIIDADKDLMLSFKSRKEAVHP